LYAGDQQLAETKYLAAGTVGVPAADTTYRIDYQVDNDAPWAALSTRTSSQWTFRSHTAAAGKVEIPATDHRRLRPEPRPARPGAGHWPVVIGVNLGHQAGSAASPISTASLDYSADDGGHWRQRR